MTRILDARVAKAKGWKPHVVANYPWQMVPPVCDAELSADDPALVVLSVPHYSTDISMAWLLLENLTRDHSVGISSTWKQAKGDHESTEWNVLIRRRGEIEPSIVRASTAPVAICMAFLEAMGT